MRALTRRLTRHISRRAALRTVFTVGVVAGTAGALAPVLAHRAAREGARPPKAGVRPELERFAEMYRGRHIQGTATFMVPAGGAGTTTVAVRTSTRGTTTVAVPSVEIRIDDRPLHVMRRADGSYLSLVNHYESFPTLRDVARAAVDELGSAQLALSPSHSH
ncbi:tyrosinase family oxidase copper chaperone [Streptomyces sp. NPDC055078]